MTSDSKAPDAAAVYLYREEITDDPHHFRTVYARLKVLTTDGLQAAVVHVPIQKNFVYYAMGDNSSRFASASSSNWSMPSINHAGEDAPVDLVHFNVKGNVAALEGRTIHPDGTIVPLTGSAVDLLKVKRDSSGQIADVSFTMPAVTVGSILEYRYQIRYDQYEQAPDWQIQQPYFVHQAHYSFTPAEPMLRMRSGDGAVSDSALLDSNGETMTGVDTMANLPAGAAVKQEANGSYTVDLTDIPALPDEHYAPPVAAEAYRVSFFYTPVPDSKGFWQKEMGYWNKKVEGYTNATTEIKRTVAEIVSSSDAPADKAKKIYLFVQGFENTDFNANGVPNINSEWVPRGHVDRLLETKKGTSNQLAFLYLALARAAGLDAHPVRISSRSHRIFSADFLRNDQLDTVLIALNGIGNQDGSQVFVDPGTKMAPFATLHWAHTGAGGITMNGNKVETLITPLQKVTDNMTLHVGELNVQPSGMVLGILKVAFIGQKALELRQLGVQSGADGVKDAVNQLLAKEVPQGAQAKVDHIDFLGDPSHQLLAIVNVSGSLAAAGGRVALPRAFFGNGEVDPFPQGNRVEPIDARYPAEDQERISYLLAPGLSLGAEPQDAEVKDAPNAVYDAKVTTKGSTVVSTRVLARGFTLLDAKDYTDLSDFYGKVAQYDREQFALNAAQAGKGQ